MFSRRGAPQWLLEVGKNGGEKSFWGDKEGHHLSEGPKNLNQRGPSYRENSRKLMVGKRDIPF